MGDLKVKDAEFKATSEKVVRFGAAFEADAQEYLRILLELCSSGITEGETARRLSTFTAYAGTLIGKAEEIVQFADKSLVGYVEEVDKDDEYLY